MQINVAAVRADLKLALQWNVDVSFTQSLVGAVYTKCEDLKIVEQWNVDVSFSFYTIFSLYSVQSTQNVMRSVKNICLAFVSVGLITNSYHVGHLIILSISFIGSK